MGWINVFTKSVNEYFGGHHPVWSFFLQNGPIWDEKFLPWKSVPSTDFYPSLTLKELTVTLIYVWKCGEWRVLQTPKLINDEGARGNVKFIKALSLLCMSENLENFRIHPIWDNFGKFWNSSHMGQFWEILSFIPYGTFLIFGQKTKKKKQYFQNRTVIFKSQ